MTAVRISPFLVEQHELRVPVVSLGVRHREHEAVAAVEETTLEEIRADERPVAVQDSPRRASRACRAHASSSRWPWNTRPPCAGLPRDRRRRDAGASREKPRRALHDDALVHEVVGEARLVAAEEARHAVRPPAAVAHEAAAVAGKARQVVRIVRGRVASGNDREDLAAQVRRHPFIRVD